MQEPRRREGPRPTEQSDDSRQIHGQRRRDRRRAGQHRGPHAVGPVENRRQLPGTRQRQRRPIWPDRAGCGRIKAPQRGKRRPERAGGDQRAGGIPPGRERLPRAEQPEQTAPQQDGRGDPARRIEPQHGRRRQAQRPAPADRRQRRRRARLDSRSVHLGGRSCTAGGVSINPKLRAPAARRSRARPTFGAAANSSRA